MMKCEFCRISLTIILIIVVIFVIAYQFTEPAPPKAIGMASGREGGGYHTFALKYQQYLAQKQFTLDLKPVAGAVEALQLLKTGAVSVAFLQGGIADDTEGLQSLASVFYEPLWIFHHKDKPLNYIFELRGQRVAIGEENSGTQRLALQLLNDNHVNKDNTTFFNISGADAAQQLIKGELDAAILVMSPKAQIIKELINNPLLDLMSFRRHKAYTRRYPYLTTVTIGEGMINLEHNIPQSDKILLATTASLVAREQLHPNIIRLLLMAAEDTHESGGFLEEPGQFPSKYFVEFPLSSEAKHYLEHGPSWLENLFPFWVASTLDRLKIMLIPLIAIVLPLLKGVLPLYRWGIRFKIFRWYRMLREIDHQVEEMDNLEAIETASRRLRHLQQELLDEVSVPLSYMNEFYTLRVHINVILARLKERQKEIAAQQN